MVCVRFENLFFGRSPPSFPSSPQTPVIHSIAAQYCDIADLSALSPQIVEVLLSPQLMEEIVYTQPTHH